MADNTVLNPGTGGDAIASDDIAGVKFQRVKVTHGGDGAATDVSTSSGLPVQQQGTWTVTATQSTAANLNATVTVANAAGATSVPVQGAAAHDAVVAGNPVLIAGFASATPPVAVADGDAARIWVDANGRVQIGDGGGSLTVDNGGTFAVQAAQSGAWNVTNISGTVSLPTGASTAAKQPALGTAGVASADVLTVQGIASMTPLLVNGSAVTQPVSGTVTVQDGGGAITVDGTVTVTATNLDVRDLTSATDSVAAVGNIAHDGVDSGNPVGVGLRAIDHGTNPTAVAAADRTVWYANRAGVPFVMGGHPNIVTVEAEYTAAQTNAAIVTVGAGAKIVVTRISAMLDHATTVDVGLRVGFATATTPTTTGVVLTHPGLAPGSGVVEGNGGGILGIGADNEDLRITSEVPTTGALRILVSYYTVPA